MKDVFNSLPKKNWKEERRRNTFSAFSLVRSIQKQVRLTVTGIDRERLEESVFDRHVLSIASSIRSSFGGALEKSFFSRVPNRYH